MVRFVFVFPAGPAAAEGVSVVASAAVLLLISSAAELQGAAARQLLHDVQAQAKNVKEMKRKLWLISVIKAMYTLYNEGTCTAHSIQW